MVVYFLYCFTLSALAGLGSEMGREAFTFPSALLACVLLACLDLQGGRESVKVCFLLFSSQLFPKLSHQIPGDQYCQYKWG